jgi:hypothetical protein
MARQLRALNKAEQRIKHYGWLNGLRRNPLLCQPRTLEAAEKLAVG